MLEKEIAGIMHFVLDAAGNPAPYYHNVPESFAVPSVFFPSPEIEFQPDTLSSYSEVYTMFVKFFHSSTEMAYELALPVFHGINAVRGKIPLYDVSGKKTGEIIRIKNTHLKKADECAYQLQIDWVSRIPYTHDEAQLVRNFYINGGKI